MRGGVFLKNDLNVKLISMEDIMAAKCCDIQEVIRVIEEVLVDYKNGGVMLPDKISQIFNLETQDRINCMPSTLMKDGVCGVKSVDSIPKQVDSCTDRKRAFYADGMVHRRLCIPAFLCKSECGV